MVDLQPFDQSDWDCFSGCTSKNPEIAWLENYAIILDGLSVEVTFMDDGAGVDVWAKEYSSQPEARRMGDLLSSQVAGNVREVMHFSGFRKVL